MWASGILSAICYSLMSVAVAHYGSGISASEFLLGRSLVGLTFLCPFLVLSKSKNAISPMLILRGVIGTLAIIILFIMIQNVGAGTATAIHYTSPIYITLLCVLFMNEKLHPQKIIALSLVIIGVIVPVFSNIGNLNPAFLMLGTLGAILSGVSFFLLKIMTSKISEISIYWMFCLVQLAVQIPLHFMSSNPVFHIRFSSIFSSVGLPCLVVGLLACAAQLLMNNSFKKLSATTASILNLLSIPLTVLIEYFVFHREYGESQCFMIALIFSGIILLKTRVFSEQTTLGQSSRL